MRRYKQIEIRVSYEGRLLYKLTVIGDGAICFEHWVLRHYVTKRRNQIAEQMAEEADRVTAGEIPDAFDMKEARREMRARWASQKSA